MFARVVRNLTVNLLLVILVVTSCSSPTSGYQDDATRRSATTVDDFVARVSSASPEVASDLLIRIAQSKLIADKKRRLSLIEEAYRRAFDAQKKVRMKRWSGLVDTPSGYLSAAYDLELDELSLRTRAIKVMLSLDSNRARELFTEIPKLKLPALTCADSLGYDVSGFYQTLKEVQQKSFTAKEISEGQGLRFLQPYLADVVSPAQLSPAMAVIAEAELSSSELTILVSTLVSALKGVQEDPRSFELSLTSGNFANNLQRLLTRIGDKDVASTTLLNAFKAYFIRELGVQCPGSLVGKEQKNRLQTEFLRVNKLFVNTISEDELTPRIGERLKESQFWTTRESQNFLTKTKRLRFGNGVTALTEEQRNTDEWQRELGQLLMELGQWTGSAESESDLFHQKCALYDALFTLSPNNTVRSEVLLAYANHLRGSAMQGSRIEWLLHGNSLLKKTRNLGPQRAKIIDVLNTSTTQALQLYSEFEDLIAATAVASGKVGTDYLEK